MSDFLRVQVAYKRYIEARTALLDELQLNRNSNRDPLAEFSEWLVATLVGGTLAESSVQRGWDVQGSDNEKIQVKYLANSNDKWVNEHCIQVTELMDSYAMVVFEALLPQAVIIFPVANLGSVAQKLQKRHKYIDTTLQFTRANYRQIQREIAEFKLLGVRLYLAPDWNLE